MASLCLCLCLSSFPTGEFGLVYKAKWTLKNLPVAVKTLRGGATEEQKENFLFEATGKTPYAAATTNSSK